MKVGVAKETAPGERRVALVPEALGRLQQAGLEILVETGAGGGAAIPDSAFAEAGATVVPTDALYEQSDVVLRVAKPDAAEVARLRKGQAVVGFLAPLIDPALARDLAAKGVTAISLDAIPRTLSRAQSMDALSSQANVGGYKAVLIAANAYGRYFPLLMTAAGTVTPAHVLVIGAGVAGLSAIATARRLGAVVRAFDPRPPVREQVESLGARFIELDIEAIGETTGGYAAAQSEAFLDKERELLAGHVADVDVVITTAAIPGQAAPILITEDMARSMKPGSVIVDLAAERGGNCALTRPGDLHLENGLTVIGYTDFPSRMAEQASLLYARTVWNLLSHLWGDDGPKIDLADEIVTAAALVHAGEDRRPRREA
jgi:NAD(P) transhydrogenase subunit alpha